MMLDVIDNKTPAYTGITHDKTANKKCHCPPHGSPSSQTQAGRKNVSDIETDVSLI